MVERAILDKRVHVGKNARIGGGVRHADIRLVLVGKSSKLPAELVVEPGAEIGTNLVPTDFENLYVMAGQSVQTNRKPHEI